MVYVKHMQQQDYDLTIPQEWTTNSKHDEVTLLSKETIDTLNSMDDEALDEYFQILAMTQGGSSQKTQHYDIHNGRILVLFRHLVELVVRLTVLREEGNLVGLGKKVEEVIVSRLSTYVNDSIQKKDMQLDEEKILLEKYKEISSFPGLSDIFLQSST